MRRWATIIAAIVLAATPVSWADPVGSQVEEVDIATINGSIQVSLTGPPEYISYEITVTRSTGQHLASTDPMPGAEYTNIRGCIRFEASFFSDEGCGTLSPKRFSQDPELNRSKGTFTARMRTFGARVRVSFTIKGTGSVREDQRYGYNLSQPSLSGSGQIGDWRDRSGKPKGSLLWPGYPRVPINGTAKMSHGTVISALADL